MTSLPVVLLLPRRALARRDAVRVLVARLSKTRDFERAQLSSVFALKNDELEFARGIAARTNLWVYRVNQRAFAGDFVVVDVSSPDVQRRPAVALDLKAGGRVREDRAGVQMRRTDRAIAALAERGVVATSCVPVHVVGDGQTVLASIDRVLRRARARTPSHPRE